MNIKVGYVIIIFYLILIKTIYILLVVLVKLLKRHSTNLIKLNNTLQNIFIVVL